MFLGSTRTNDITSERTMVIHTSKCATISLPKDQWRSINHPRSHTKNAAFGSTTCQAGSRNIFSAISWSCFFRFLWFFLCRDPKNAGFFSRGILQVRRILVFRRKAIFQDPLLVSEHLFFQTPKNKTHSHLGTSINFHGLPLLLCTSNTFLKSKKHGGTYPMKQTKNGWKGKPTAVNSKKKKQTNPPTCCDSQAVVWPWWLPVRTLPQETAQGNGSWKNTPRKTNSWTPKNMVFE